MVEKKKSPLRSSRFIHEDVPTEEVIDPMPSNVDTVAPLGTPAGMSSLYSVGAGAPLEQRRAAQATTERDRLALKKKSRLS